jgi:hypothetical protein
MSGPLDHEANETKRDFLRLPLGVLGFIETLNGRQRVEIVDLSQGGAYVVLMDAAKASRYEVRDCVLRWMNYEAFGEVKRRDGVHFGIAFDEPLRPGVIKDTRKHASLNIRNDFYELKDAARLWARGIYTT